MMKTKYERMTKEEKRALYQRYKQTENGTNMSKRLFRLNLIGCLGLIYSVGLFIYEYKDIKVLDYLIIIPLFLASIFFLMMSCKLKKKILTKFAVAKKSK